MKRAKKATKADLQREVAQLRQRLAKVARLCNEIGRDCRRAEFSRQYGDNDPAYILGGVAALSYIAASKAIGRDWEPRSRHHKAMRRKEEVDMAAQPITITSPQRSAHA